MLQVRRHLAQQDGSACMMPFFVVMDFPMHGDTISMELSIFCFKGLKIEIIMHFCHEQFKPRFGHYDQTSTQISDVSYEPVRPYHSIPSSHTPNVDSRFREEKREGNRELVALLCLPGVS